MKFIASPVEWNALYSFACWLAFSNKNYTLATTYAQDFYHVMTIILFQFNTIETTRWDEVEHKGPWMLWSLHGWSSLWNILNILLNKL